MNVFHCCLFLLQLVATVHDVHNVLDTYYNPPPPPTPPPPPPEEGKLVINCRPAESTLN